MKVVTFLFLAYIMFSAPCIVPGSRGVQYLLNESRDEWIIDQMNTWRDSKDLREQAIFELPFYKREGSSSHSEQYLQRLGTLLWSVQRRVSPQGWMEHRILGNKTRKMVWLEGRWVSPYSTNRYSECTRSQLLDQQGWLLKNTVHFLYVRRFVRHLVHIEK